MIDHELLKTQILKAVLYESYIHCGADYTELTAAERTHIAEQAAEDYRQITGLAYVYTDLDIAQRAFMMTLDDYLDTIDADIDLLIDYAE